MYDIVIIGAGPAGLCAALYARRAEKSVLVIERSTFGGQITHSPRVENYPGTLQMSGTEFADKFIDQVMQQGADIEMDTVLSVDGSFGNYKIHCEDNTYEGKTVIIATGSKHRTLGLPKEEDFTGEGISYCAVCDGAFYKDKTVAVVGGGNTALQEVCMLSDLCKKVIVVQNLPFLTAEGSLVSDIKARNNVDVILSSVVTEILGDDSFKGIRISTDGKESELPVDGVFVAIGQMPENEPYTNLVKLNQYGYIEADESCVPTDAPKGIFTAGDCRSKTTRQITTAIADGAVAAITACRLIDSNK